jgi:DNA primase
MYALEDVITDLLGPRRGYGQNAMYRCPLHDDRTASLSVNLDTGLWLCFGCGRKGGIKTLFREMGESIDGDTTLRLAVRQAESTEDYIPPPLLDEQARRAHRALAHEPEHSRWERFCKRRGIDPALEEAYQIGWDKEREALVFPYYDTDGRCGGIKYRDARGNKWSAEGSRFRFFGPSIVGRDTVVICEGESDTLRVRTALDSLQSQVAVAGTSGASLSDAHWSPMAIQLLFTNRVFLLYDADEPGERCASAAMRVLGDKAIRIRPTRGKDATDHLNAGGTLDEIGLGASTLHV